MPEPSEPPVPRHSSEPDGPAAARGAGARNVARIVGLVAVVIGAVWVGQGLGYLPGSFMTGVRFWFWVGVACVLGGLGLLLASRRR